MQVLTEQGLFERTDSGGLTCPFEAVRIDMHLIAPQPLAAWICLRALLDCHALGRIARLIDIGPSCAGRVIGQQLQRHDMQDRAWSAVMLGHADDVYAGLVAEVGVVVGKDVELAAAGADLLQIALELFRQRVVRRHGDHGHLVGDQGQRPVLQLSRRVGLGMDVADLPELERSFQRDRIVQAAARTPSSRCAGAAGFVPLR